MDASARQGSERDSGTVNPHYLDHVVASAERRDVQASEDIVTGNGVKLLAKGSRIDARTRDRLLQHKLAKPFEDCVQLSDGVVPALFGPLAEELLDQHQMLRVLCAHERAQVVSGTLSSLRLSRPVQSLLTVYADYQGDRLAHSVGVAMLTLGLARRLLPAQIDRHRLLALAGLLHDVGELYIDPAYLRRGAPLLTEQWRHIVSHPVIGHRVLSGMEGAGLEVAGLVMNHHERLDGFGYPRGLMEEDFPLEHQILSAAEWLMALVDSGSAPLARASVASKLIPGEFSPAILMVINAAAQESSEMSAWLAAQEPLLAALPKVELIVGTLQRFKLTRPWLDAQIAAAGKELRAALQLGRNRMLRIQASFSSTGLDSNDPVAVLGDLAAQDDVVLHQELHALIGEFGWRMRELERESLLRAGQLPSADLAVMQELIGRLRGERALEAPQAKGPPGALTGPAGGAA